MKHPHYTAKSEYIVDGFEAKCIHCTDSWILAKNCGKYWNHGYFSCSKCNGSFILDFIDENDFAKNVGDENIRPVNWRPTNRILIGMRESIHNTHGFPTQYGKSEIIKYVP